MSSEIDYRINQIYDGQSYFSAYPLSPCSVEKKRNIKILSKIGEGEYGSVYKIETAKKLSPSLDPLVLKKAIVRTNDALNIANSAYPQPLPVSYALSSSSAEITSFKLCNILVDHEVTENLPLIVDYATCTTSNTVEMIAEYAPLGDLNSFARKNTKMFTPEFSYAMIFQLFYALSSLSYYYGLVHNDLHYGNVLVYKRRKPINKNKFNYYQIGTKLFKVPVSEYMFVPTDFGFARFKAKGNLAKISDIDRICGFAEWLRNDSITISQKTVNEMDYFRYKLENKEYFLERDLADYFPQYLTNKIENSDLSVKFNLKNPARAVPTPPGFLSHA